MKGCALVLWMRVVILSYTTHSEREIYTFRAPTTSLSAAAARSTTAASRFPSSSRLCRRALLPAPVAVEENGAEKGGDNAGPRPHLALPLHAVEPAAPPGDMDLQLEGLRDHHHLHHHPQLRHHDARREARQRRQGHPLGTIGERILWENFCGIVMNQGHCICRLFLAFFLLFLVLLPVCKHSQVLQ